MNLAVHIHFQPKPLVLIILEEVLLSAKFLGRMLGRDERSGKLRRFILRLLVARENVSTQPPNLELL